MRENATAGPERAYRAHPFDLTEPAALTSGVVISSPHSGRAYFSDFAARSRLAGAALRASEDAFVERLVAAGVSAGAPLLAAVAPRAFVDLNRRADDLDPELIEGLEGRPKNARVLAGLGVVPRVVAEGRPIYDGRLQLSEARARIAHWHAPYHRRLHALMERARGRFGRALLVDCHSMPSAVRMADRSNAFGADGPRGGEIVLGDRFGAACDPALVRAVEAAFRSEAFSVARNAPFAGGHITERFGRPEIGFNAIQIEIDRGLYLDERRVRRTKEFAAVAARIGRAMRVIAGFIGEGSADEAALAAE